MTSNIGSAFLQSENLRSPEEFDAAREQVMNALHGHFRPEFLNRVDDIIVFSPLSEEQLTAIIELRLADLRRLLGERKITLELTPHAKELLFIEGYDRAFGARPLKRAIQRMIQDPLALKVLSGEVQNGDRVKVDADLSERKMTFVVERGGAAAAEELVPAATGGRKTR
jgi:ATP-dependent Clp protease ATP-binding subunit ClpB